MDLTHQFSKAEGGTIQLELSGGGAHGAYECGALEIFFPFWTARGYRVDAVTGVSAGAVNAALISSALNQGQDPVLAMNRLWDKVAAEGDFYLGPALHLYRLNHCFNFFARSSDRFPNIPARYMSLLQLGAKSSLPLSRLKDLLDTQIGQDGWRAVRDGPVQTFVAALEVLPDGTRSPVIFTGRELNAPTVLASGALRDFGDYKIGGRRYEDGGYEKIGFFLKDHKTDVLFAIGLKPLRNADELEDHRGVKTGQLHHDLTRYAVDPERECTIDFICLDPPEYWNETSAMNTTSENIDALRAMGRDDAETWIKSHGATFGMKDSFTPSPDVLRLVNPDYPALEAA